MFDRLDQFARTLPEPRLGDSWEAFHRQHVRNAELMRAEAFRYAVQDIGRGLRRASRALAARLGAISSRAGAGGRRAHAWRGGAD